MGNISGVKANIPIVKQTYKKLVALGEKANGAEYKMEIEGYPDLTFLVSSVSLPAIQREMMETFGPYGIKIQQQGKFINSQDIPITFDEVITGKALKALRDWVKNKKYLRVTLGLVSESQDTSDPNTSVECEDCWLECEAIELGNENSATVVKPSGTLHANWVSWLDDDANPSVSF